MSQQKSATAPLHQGSSSGPWLDHLGIGLSLACLIHCLLLPLAIILTPYLGGWLLTDYLFHLYLLFIILPVSLLAFAAGWRRHRNTPVLISGLAGLAIIGMAALQAAWLNHSLFSAIAEKILTSLGGAMLMLGHLLNLRRY